MSAEFQCLARKPSMCPGSSSNCQPWQSCPAAPLPWHCPNKANSASAYRWQKPLICLALYSMSAVISMRRRRYISEVQGGQGGQEKGKWGKWEHAASCGWGYSRHGKALAQAQAHYIEGIQRCILLVPL